MRADDILNPVQPHGSYADKLPLFGGLNIWKACPVIVEALNQAGRLLASSPLQHSYPHCWRPVNDEYLKQEITAAQDRQSTFAYSFSSEDK